MHTMVKTGAIAATLLAAVAMTATPSEARCRHCGAAAAGFIGGLALGVIAANAHNNNYYAGPGYYGDGYGPGDAYYGGPSYGYYDAPVYYDPYAYAPRPFYNARSSYRPGSYMDSLSDR